MGRPSRCRYAASRRTLVAIERNTLISRLAHHYLMDGGPLSLRQISFMMGWELSRTRRMLALSLRFLKSIRIEGQIRYTLQPDMLRDWLHRQTCK